MTKQHYKLIGKLYSASILYNVECAFEPDELLDHTTENQMQITAEECRAIGEKLAKGHEVVLSMGSIGEISEYVENLYYE